MPTELSKPARFMLLIMAANGGSMDKQDLKIEFDRIMSLSDAEQERWVERMRPLIRQHFDRVKGSSDFL